MIEFFRGLLSSDFMPHGACYLWQPEIIWLHALSDGVITLSYYLIPLGLVYFVRKRPDLPFHWIFLLFGAFIFGCGTTHLMEIWTLWHGTYRLAGVIKALTAGVSVLTAVMLVPLIPRALALPSPAQLREANKGLEREIAERRRAEAALQAARDELERRVEERTAELARANEELRAEMGRRQQADEERQQAKQALLKMQGELAHVARVTTMGELAASIAHEVNQPLTAIATNTNACLRWLSADPPNLEEVRAGLTRILRDGKRADDVIRRIRGLLKKESPQAGPQDVNALIREVLALLNDPLRSHHIGTKVELSSGVPAVLGDRVQLQQVVLNLVLNAIDAMSAVAGRARSLVVGSRREDSDGVEVTVSDSGAGVAAVDFDRLFDPFFTTKAEGMGMGLSVSRKIVESFGGRLWASANEGPGTTFHLTLRPVARAPASGA